MDMSWNEAKDWCQTQGRQLACWIGLNCIDSESGHWVSNDGSDSENSEKLQSDNQFDSAFCVEMSSVLDGVWTGKSCSDQSHLHLPLCGHQGICGIFSFRKMQR